MKTWLQLVLAIAQIVVAWFASRRRAEDREAGQADQIIAAEKDEAIAKRVRLRLRVRNDDRLRQAEQPVGSVQPGPGNGPGAAG